ncbi:BUD13 homolog [Drosophila biarmipes]|uniref:BUD13 homolog n=1 Tax=Drosophila biarmipes TaxID=125945 RepID=UPI0007E8A4FF|nr:BUD13 homolog [Drosophila biarmipes]
MSMQKAKIIDQKEYLKKYLSGDKEKKKKRKEKKHKKGAAKVRIIDDDAYDKDDQEVDEDLLLGGEDAPQIVGEYIEEDPNVRSKWRNIAVKDEIKEEEGGESSAAAPAIRIKQEPLDEEQEVWGRKASVARVKDEFSPTRRIKQEKRSSSRDLSPARSRKPSKREQSPRRRSRDRSPSRRSANSSDQSPPLRGRDADQSPPRRKRRDSDQSPPRKARNGNQSPARRRRDSDQSPPRNRKNKKSPTRRRRDSDQSPARRRRSNSDQSPPRRRADRDAASPRRRRDSDQSPPRRRKGDDQSPPRRRRKDSDQSPPRKRRGDDLSPVRKRRDSDQSPPRRRRDDKQSPPRRRRNSDQSPPRRPKVEDQSPPRRRRDSDLSRRSLSRSPAPRNRFKEERKSRWGKASPSKSASPPPTHKPKSTKTLDGKKAGLQDAKSLKKETDERRRQEHDLFEKMSSEISGRDGEVQVRSTRRKGHRAREAANEDPAERSRKEEHEKKKKELYDRWGKGLKQIEERQSRLEEMAHEASKPVARYADDEDLDRHLREQEHADDPMLEYMRQKRKKRDQQDNKPVIPKYEGSFPENRFGIPPGYRWDGVDRSNGYEQRWFDKQNERRAVQDEAYKYSVEDM